MPLQVNEIFHSIQGESSFAGWPCAFIRLSGCNLRCSYCDTTYAYTEGRPFSLREIVAQVETFACPLIEVTGGEPLLQKETPALINALLEKKHQVLVETNGSLNMDVIPSQATVIMDIKCPSSGEAKTFDFGNLKRLKENDQIKFVISNHEDYVYAKRILAGLPEQTVVNFSPVFRTMPPAELAEWVLKDKLRVRFNLQMHKYIWDPDRRGV